MNVINISETQRNNLCKFGQGEKCCSYLVMGPEGFGCAKGTSLEMLINDRRKQKTMRAKGDNCSGAPSFTPNQLS